VISGEDHEALWLEIPWFYKEFFMAGAYIGGCASEFFAGGSPS
jgi:hypothetical protein